MKIRVSWLVNVLAIMATLPMANAEKYKDASIPGLELCKEFKAYLERHPEKALFCELIPDPLFKNFRLPDLKPAPRGLGERVFFQAGTVTRENYRTLKVEYQLERYQKMVKSFEKSMSSDVRYKIGVMDINHDGNEEPVVVHSRPNLCLKKNFSVTSILPYHESGNIQSEWIDSSGYPKAGGEPFYYKGRVYLIEGNLVGISVYEPSSFGSSKLLTGREVCRYIPLKTKN